MTELAVQLQFGWYCEKSELNTLECWLASSRKFIVRHQLNLKHGFTVGRNVLEKIGENWVHPLASSSQCPWSIPQSAAIGCTKAGSKYRIRDADDNFIWRQGGKIKGINATQIVVKRFKDRAYLIKPNNLERFSQFTARMVFALSKTP